MGIGADASTSGHQLTQAGPVSPAGELYCESCHTVHDGTNDHYLNPQVITDFDPANSALFCIACHSDKSIEDLGTSGKGHHQITPYNQCLFCHSIHNSQNDPDALYQTDEDEANIHNASVSVDVFMRVPPINLAWADKEQMNRVFPYDFHRHTLENGLTALLVPMASEGLVAYWTVVRTGSRDEAERSSRRSPCARGSSCAPSSCARSSCGAWPRWPSPPAAGP